MRRVKSIYVMIVLGSSLSLLFACRDGLPLSTISTTDTPHIETSSSTPEIATRSPTTEVMPSLTPTVDAVQPAIRSTAEAADRTAEAFRQQTREAEATKVAEFPAPCDEDIASEIMISPDDQWLAAGCADKRDLRMAVVNQDGKKWELKFKDFIHPNSLQNGETPLGSLYPKVWSSDGVYLYFSPALGYSGGGDQCFPRFDEDYGLFRLNVRNGSWVTLIPPTDLFPGHGIEFAPTGRRYAVDMNGVTITDLNTGKVVMLDVPATVEGLSWSPDGTRLAYTVAGCGDDQLVKFSSVYIWDASANQTQELFSVDGVLLTPEEWLDNSTLTVWGEQYSGLDTIYTIYEYDLLQRGLILSETVTPFP
jgi:WD40 repeat protein